jgi:hypothetical protein
VLARFRLTLANAAGEGDHPLTRTRTIDSPRTGQSRRAQPDECIARMMRKHSRARLTADVALLLSSGVRLLVRHEPSSGGRLLLRQNAVVHDGERGPTVALDIVSRLDGRATRR